MPYPGLEVVVQYWLYSLVDDWRSTPRGVTLPGGRRVHAAGDPPAPRGRLGGGHGRALGRPPAVRRLERALRRRVAALRGRDARRRPRRRAHAPGLVDRARLARQPAGGRDRATALVALRPARGDVRAPARRGHHRPGRDGRDRQPPRRRARDPRPRRQRRAAGVPARARQPPDLADDVPGHLGRPRARRGRPGQAHARLVAADADAAEALARPARDDLRRRRRAAAAAEGRPRRPKPATLRGCRFPVLPPPGAFPLRPSGPALSRSSTTPTPHAPGRTTSSPRCARSRRATATS